MQFTVSRSLDQETMTGEGVLPEPGLEDSTHLFHID
jgi:hypothetical protein